MRGILVGFESPQALEEALQRLAAADRELTGTRFEQVETHTPMPLAEDEASGSPLPLAMFIAGLLGFIGFFLLMTYADVHAYPLDVGGRPDFAWPAFIPVAFELGVLCAMAAGFFGFLAICRMPQPYDPIDECESFGRASRDRWFLAVRSDDSQRLALARAALEKLNPSSVEEFRA